MVLLVVNQSWAVLVALESLWMSMWSVSGNLYRSFLDKTPLTLHNFLSDQVDLGLALWSRLMAESMKDQLSQRWDHRHQKQEVPSDYRVDTYQIYSIHVDIGIEIMDCTFSQIRRNITWQHTEKFFFQTSICCITVLDYQQVDNFIS